MSKKDEAFFRASYGAWAAALLLLWALPTLPQFAEASPWLCGAGVVVVVFSGGASLIFCAHQAFQKKGGWTIRCYVDEDGHPVRTDRRNRRWKRLVEARTNAEKEVGLFIRYGATLGIAASPVLAMLWSSFGALAVLVASGVLFDFGLYLNPEIRVENVSEKDEEKARKRRADAKTRKRDGDRAKARAEARGEKHRPLLMWLKRTDFVRGLARKRRFAPWPGSWYWLAQAGWSVVLPLGLTLCLRGYGATGAVILAASALLFLLGQYLYKLKEEAVFQVPVYLKNKDPAGDKPKWKPVDEPRNESYRLFIWEHEAAFPEEADPADFEPAGRLLEVVSWALRGIALSLILLIGPAGLVIGLPLFLVSFAAFQIATALSPTIRVKSIETK